MGVELFSPHRALLFSIAYRMLGSVSDAEDMVQETFLRWSRVDTSEVQSPKSYLTTTITRLCIDHLRSARSQRETYVGPWLPEPLVAGQGDDVADLVALEESITMAFMVMLESLSPVERAVYLLREVFDYPYATIAEIVGRSEANCRQIVHRAKDRLAGRRPPRRIDVEHGERLAGAFITACTTGDLAGLLTLLADDVTAWSDGGGRVPAAVRPIRGSDRVARFLLGINRQAPPDTRIDVTPVNGEIGLIIWVNGDLYGTMILTIADDRISTIHTVLNPEKLRHIWSAD